ncbi:hypothetical protein KR50_14050 [Jeotgalibacillus campisalis]|uniref:Uncharacterized protein n=1 Tax=Jeotgalibacillus campisalis TaxID=220754 RepID=A0A0C2S2Y5_9BACL|nr:hypothetical protein KR50_14050 [Jeotgalibacillus campisalis]
MDASPLKILIEMKIMNTLIRLHETHADDFEIFCHHPGVPTK